MTPQERAQHYAALFTSVGEKWRQCVPIDGKPHRYLNEMKLDGVVIAKSDDVDGWRLRRS